MDKLFLYLTALSGGGAYAVVFGILFACGLGLPLPEDIPLIATGYLSVDGTMSLVPAFVVTMIGVLTGDSMLFFLGRRLAPRLRAPKEPVLFFSPRQIRRARAYFRKYGQKIIFFARFVAGIRGLVFFMAGALHVKYRRFIILDGIAALVSVPLWIALGYWLGHRFGDEIDQVLHHMGRFKNAASILILGGLLIFGLRLWQKWQKAQQARRAES